MIKKSRSLILKIGLGAAIAAAAGACSPTVHQRGNLLDDEQMETLRPGETTRQQVVQNLGSPSTTDAFDRNTWYYVGRRERVWAFLNPNVERQRVVVVRFDDQGILQDVRTLGLEDARDVQVVERETPTRGREPSLVQSLYDLLITGPVRSRRGLGQDNGGFQR